MRLARRRERILKIICLKSMVWVTHTDRVRSEDGNRTTGIERKQSRLESVALVWARGNDG